MSTMRKRQLSVSVAIFLTNATLRVTSFATLAPPSATTPPVTYPVGRSSHGSTSTTSQEPIVLTSSGRFGRRNDGWLASATRMTTQTTTSTTSTSTLHTPSSNGRAVTGHRSRTSLSLTASSSSSTASSSPSSPSSSIEKELFYQSLEHTASLNAASPERTELLEAMVLTNPTPRPGSSSSFLPVATGTWRIVYAPHISTLSGLVGATFDPVSYELTGEGGGAESGGGGLAESGRMVSHAKYAFPRFFGSVEGWLSVSGTFGSVDDHTCRVDFNRAWIGLGSEEKYGSYEDAPDRWYKEVINQLGQAGFRKEFAVFPVSYLDSDTIVFDFELFGTRICARKI